MSISLAYVDGKSDVKVAGWRPHPAKVGGWRWCGDEKGIWSREGRVISRVVKSTHVKNNQGTYTTIYYLISSSVL